MNFILILLAIVYTIFCLRGIQLTWSYNDPEREAMGLELTKNGKIFFTIFYLSCLVIFIIIMILWS